MLSSLSRRYLTISRSFHRSFSSSSDAKYFVLQYTYVDDMLNKRVPHRAAHLEMTREFVENGSLLLGGAFTDPVDTGLIIFKAGSKEEVDAFARKDPYVREKLVTSYSIREWAVVVGSKI